MLEKYQKIHIIGIGGISLSALALILKENGKDVTGTDRHLSKITDELEKKGIKIKKDFCKEFVEQADLVVYTSAISDCDEDFCFAKQYLKPTMSRAELLGELTKDCFTISIAGSHGKTTATAMIGYMFECAKRDPTIHVGGIMKNFHSNVIIGKSKHFITEACEYKDSFLHLKNDNSIILNEAPDHLDYFKNEDNYYKSFQKFAENTKKNGVLIINNDNCHLTKNVLNCNIFTYAINKKADLQAKNLKINENGFWEFEVFYLGLSFGIVKLNILGKHNIYNALCTVAVGIVNHIPLETIKFAIASFEGVERRLEFITNLNGAIIIHDYAHHPDEIVASIQTCKQLNKKRLITIFQPHTYTRTRDLYYQFCEAFFESDEVWLLPIYPAREKPLPKITSLFFAKGIKSKNKFVRYFSNFDKCFKFINKIADSNCLFLILGAGDVEELAYKFKKR